MAFSFTEVTTMMCKDCAYWYKDATENGEEYGNPYCHYYHNDGYAPCEIEEEQYEESADD